MVSSQAIAANCKIVRIAGDLIFVHHTVVGEESEPWWNDSFEKPRFHTAYVSICRLTLERNISYVLLDHLMRNCLLTLLHA